MIKSIGLSLLFLCVISCKKEVKNLPEDFDFGTAENNTYSNSYFGLTFNYPSEWTQQSKHDIKAITDKGEKYLARDNNQLKSILKASQINTAYLFTLFRQPIKKATGYNASLNVVAENISGTPNVKRGRDYLFNSKELLKQTRAQYDFEDEFGTKNIDGYTFDVMRATASFGSYKVQQEFFCIIRYGFSLSFVLSYTNDEEKLALYDMVNSIQLD